jgi:misacylated tRNA(Ala) deacylase
VTGRKLLETLNNEAGANGLAYICNRCKPGRAATMEPTKRLYWNDDHMLRASGVVVDVRAGGVALDQTCFYAGGGGQPPDHGTLSVDTATENITDVNADDDGVLWHCCASTDPGWIGKTATMCVDETRRSALSRYHTVLHLVNTVALRDYGAWITGAQIDVSYARIDFRWEGFSASLCADIASKVNREVAANRTIHAYSLTEQEFAARPELLRTLQVRPPVFDGRVRVVEIREFDAQACGGTHVASTGQIGRMSIERTENKGRMNKRLYVRLQTDNS